MTLQKKGPQKCQCDFCKKYGPIFDEYDKFKKDNPNLVMQRYEVLSDEPE